MSEKLLKQTNKKHRVSGRVKKILKKINSLSGHMAELSDHQLASLTDDFQARLKKGSSLDDLLPEAFAAIREADKRVLGMYPFDVQVLGAIVLHQGDIAEMKTGEGKTLTATMPLYLNALSKKGAVLVTSNSYLVEVGVDQMGPVYRFMGLSVGLGASEKKISIEEKQTIYRSDILYTTNYALGFDYLIDNLASSKEGKFMRPFNYVLIDEVDSVLLDSAQTPLVISGSPRVQSNLYEVSDDFIQTLKEGRDFKLDKERKNVWLTNKGCDLAEKYFNINNLFTAEFTNLARHIELALRVHYLFILNRDYVVEDEQVKLLDAVNGRVMENTKLQSGLHQAIEAKEHLKLSSDTRSMASITYQNLFRMFKKISGMTGTAMSDQQEFLDTYNMRVISIPTNKPMIRKDHLDRLYQTLPAKIAASVDFIKKIHATGRPILLATGSVRMSEIYSNILLKEGIAHSVLNAYNIAKEAQIIAEAGRFGTVTVATSMAGRGTDIKIDEKTRQAGGLYVIATEHLKNSRMDDQLRGRAGRQGDPGSSIFFCSLEDDLLIKYGPDWVKKYLKKVAARKRNKADRQLRRRKFQKLIEKTQKFIDGGARSSRLQSLEFDENMRIQRNIIYKLRDRLISSSDSFDNLFENMALKVFNDFLTDKKYISRQILFRFILDNLNYDFKAEELSKASFTVPEVKEILSTIVLKRIDDCHNFFKAADQLVYLQRLSLLKAIDECWIDQVDALQQLKVIVVNRQIGQKNPMYEYQRESNRLFIKMRSNIMIEAVKNFMLSDFVKEKDGTVSIFFA